MNKSPEFNSFLQQALSKDLLFACFSYPGSSDLHFLCQTSVKILTRREVKDSTLCGFIFQPFDIEQDGIWINNDIYYNNSTDLFPDLPSINYNRQFNSQIEDSLDKKSYLTDVNELIKSIKNNVAKKVVFTRTQNIELSRNNLIDVFFRLNHDHNDAFVFLVNLPGKVAWIGATPEILLKEHNKECETMALAATRASGENDEKWNEKEIAEQSYVANYIEKILSDKNIKFIKSELLEKKLNSGIKHLCQDFKFKLPENMSMWDIVYNLHPTPAICGIPVKNSMNLIDKIEKHQREFYTGFLGPVNLNKETNLFVNLRSAQISENDACLYVGGGITADSSSESEWNETELKSSTILNALMKSVN